MDFSGAVDLGKKRAPRSNVVEETDVGVYVWEMPNGAWVADDEGHWMCISARKGDLKRIQQLTDAARHYGVEEGRPVFLAGHRMISDEEYEMQRARLALGLVPDPEDVYSQMDDLRAMKNGRV